MYLLLLLAFFFAALGLVLVYFITLSVFGRAFDPESLPSIAVFGLIMFVFLFFTCGLNAALAKAYRSAIWKEKMSLVKFYSYALDKAPEMMGIMLIRELLWLLMAGPFILIYFYVLREVHYAGIIMALVVLAITFLLHMIFTPAFLSAGALESNLYTALKHAFNFWKRKHIYFAIIFTLFAFVWVFNFVPLIQLLTLFLAYPIMYSAMIVMMEGGPKAKGTKQGKQEQEEEPEEEAEPDDV